MTELPRKSHWTGVYERKAEDEVSWFQTLPRLSRNWIMASAGVADAAIVDIGGGASRLVDELLSAGCRDVTVLDIAESALTKSRARLGDRADAVQWIGADITAWVPPRRYDVWHDRAVFHFLVDAGDRAAYLAALKKGTRPGSRVIIATFAPDGPERCSGLPVQRYSPAMLDAVLGSDFTLMESAAEEHLTPAGAVQRFQYSRFERR